MSDPKREDLRVLRLGKMDDGSLLPMYHTVTDAEFDAIAKEAGYVKVWEDCPMCFGTGCHQGKSDCPSDECCPTCDGSGKMLAQGVERLESNAWHRHGAFLIHDGED